MDAATRDAARGRKQSRGDAAKGRKKDARGNGDRRRRREEKGGRCLDLGPSLLLYCKVLS